MTTRCRRNAAKKLGSEMPIRVRNKISKDQPERRICEEIIPSGRPTRTAKPSAAASNPRLLRSELLRTSETGIGLRVLVADVERPRSPLRMLPKVCSVSSAAFPSESSKDIPRAIARPKWLKYAIETSTTAPNTNRWPTRVRKPANLSHVGPWNCDLRFG